MNGMKDMKDMKNMKRLDCRILNGKKCSFVAIGRTEWDVKKAMFDHYATEHKELLLDSTEQDRRKMIDMMDKHIVRNGQKN